MDVQNEALPSYTDVLAAAERIADFCIETPLLESPFLSAKLGGRLLLKAENLQVTGSFKLRGASNRLMAMDADERKRGVVARSSGNHGLGLAFAAGKLGVSTIVVVPRTAPRAKTDRIRAYGAEVIFAEATETEAIARTFVERDGRTFVSPADDFWVVAGGGTVGAEIVRQAGKMGLQLDDLLVCCSGGGLTSGCLLATEALSPTTRVQAVEPFGFEKMALSIAAGRRISHGATGTTICDALSGPYTAQIPFQLIEGLAGTLAVTDDDVRHAMRVAFDEFGIVIEPGGAAALAAVLSGRAPVAGKVVAVTISGSNVDRALAAQILAED